MSTPTPARPALLSFGIIVNAVHAGLVILGSGIALLGMLGGFGISLVALPLVGGSPASLMFGVGALLCALYVAFYATVLYVCAQSWRGSRGATWILLGLSVIELANTGFFSAVIAVLTVVGALQYLEVLRVGVVYVGETTEVR
jgi:hypothetical protein